MKQTSTLIARTAREARVEAARRWPTQEVKLFGYHNEICVYITTIRPANAKGHYAVATAVRNRSPRPTRFTVEI